jgi:hypothetical protein
MSFTAFEGHIAEIVTPANGMAASSNILENVTFLSLPTILFPQVDQISFKIAKNISVDLTDII